MKLFIILFLSFCVIACKKDIESKSYRLKATIKTSSANSFEASFLDSETGFIKDSVPQGKEIIVSGIKKGGEYALSLVILKPAIGTFDLSIQPGWIGTNCTFDMPYFVNIYTSWGVGSGSITIESLTDSTVKGTFNAVCIRGNDTVRITDGSFNGQLH